MLSPRHRLNIQQKTQEREAPPHSARGALTNHKSPVTEKEAVEAEEATETKTTVDSPLHLVLRITSPIQQLEHKNPSSLEDTRPPNQDTQKHDDSPILSINKSPYRTMTLREPHRKERRAQKSYGVERTFALPSAVFTGDDQQALFDRHLRPFVDRMFQGFSVTVLCMGEEGSGRQYTLLGPRGFVVGEQSGILMRVLEYLLHHMAKRDYCMDFDLRIGHVEVWDAGAGSSHGYATVIDMVRQYLMRQNEVSPEGGMTEDDGIEMEEDEREMHDDSKCTAMLNEKFRLAQMRTMRIDNAEAAQSDVLRLVEHCHTHRTSREKREKSRCDHRVTTLKMAMRGKVSVDNAIVGTLHLVHCGGEKEDEESHAPSSDASGQGHNTSDCSTLLNVLQDLHESKACTMASPQQIIHRDTAPIASSLVTVLHPALDVQSPENYVVAIMHVLDSAEHYPAALRALLSYNSMQSENVTQERVRTNEEIVTEGETKQGEEDEKVSATQKPATLTGSRSTSKHMLEGRINKLEREVSEWRHQYTTLENEMERRIAQRASAIQVSSVRPFVSMDDMHHEEIQREKERRGRVERELHLATQAVAEWKERYTYKEQAVDMMKISFKNELDETRRASQTYRSRCTDLTKTLRDYQERSGRAVSLIEQQYSKELETERAQYQIDIDHMMGMYYTVPENIRKMEEQSSQFKEQESKTAEQMQTRFDETIHDMRRTHDRSYKERESAHRRIVEQKEKSIKSLAKQLRDEKEKWSQEKDTLVREVALLFKYASGLSSVIHGMETGRFPVVMRHGLKVLQIDDRDKPKPLRVDLLPHLEGRIAELRGFIEQAERGESQSSSRAGSGRSFCASSKTSSPNVPRPLKSSTPQAGQQPREMPFDAEVDIGDHYRELFLREQKRNRDLRIAHEHTKSENIRLRSSSSIKRQISATTVRRPRSSAASLCNANWSDDGMAHHVLNITGPQKIEEWPRYTTPSSSDNSRHSKRPQSAAVGNGRRR